MTLENCWLLEAVDGCGAPQALLCAPPALCHTCAGIGMFLWLNMILLKANDALRKQAALKQDRSKRQCISLAALMALHIGCVLLVLRKQELWLNFLLISIAAVPTVGCQSPACLSHGMQLLCMSVTALHVCQWLLVVTHWLLHAGVGCFLQGCSGGCACAVLGHCTQGATRATTVLCVPLQEMWKRIVLPVNPATSARLCRRGCWSCTKQAAGWSVASAHRF